MTDDTVGKRVRELREEWAYRDAMPVVPLLGAGLTPVLQWIIVPAISFWWARKGV